MKLSDSTWLKEYHALHNVGSTHHAPSYYNFLRPTLDCAYCSAILYLIVHSYTGLFIHPTP